MLLIIAALLALSQDPQYPPNQGAINDFANVLTEEAKTKLRAECAQLRDGGGPCVVVVTTPSLYGLTVEDYANQLFKKWGIGSKKEDNGLLILVAPNERKCRIEVGYGNEAKLTDLEAKAIITDVVRPLFRAGKVSESIVAGTEAVLTKLGAPRSPPTEPVPVVPTAASIDADDLVLLGMPIFVWLPLGIIIVILGLYFLARLGFLDGYSGGGGGGWSSGSSSDSDSSSSSESSSCGGGDSGGGGSSGDL